MEVGGVSQICDTLCYSIDCNSYVIVVNLFTYFLFFIYLFACLLAGTPMDGKVIIVDPDTHCEVPDGHIGEIWVTSTSCTGGYWGNPSATSATFCCKVKQFVTSAGNSIIGSDGKGKNSFLRTGDLGVWYGSGSSTHRDLFVTGRKKEMLCINGTNLYPMDIEQCVRTAHTSIRPAAIMATPVEIKDTEQLIVMIELNDAIKIGGQTKQSLGSNEIELATKLFKKAQVTKQNKTNFCVLI
jgi:acyl-CoA synthetase (AMP-forming)/AMP-acid ligase II